MVMRHKTLTLSQKQMIRNLEVRPISHKEWPKWLTLIQKYHYLGLKSLVGEKICYVAEHKGQWLALLSWSAPALETGVRDKWIGWAPVIKWQRIRYMANNSRFLVLPGYHLPNLASRVLALNLKRLSKDWKDRHGHDILIAETFVDPTHFRGSCYKGAGWLELGKTTGWGKSGKKYFKHDNPKVVFVHPLRKGARNILASPKPSPLFMEVKPMKLSLKQAENLRDALREIPDPRKTKGIRHRYLSVLAVAICAVISGAKSYIAIAQWAKNSTQNMRKRLGCRRDLKTGKYSVPSEPTLRRVLQETESELVDKVLGKWFSDFQTQECEGIAIDGKSLKGARMNGGKRVHLLSAFSHKEGMVISQKQIDEKSNEITAAIPLMQQINIENKVVTADAMLTQKKIVNYIVEEKGGDYLGMVKENQPTLFQDIAELDMPNSFPPTA